MKSHSWIAPDPDDAAESVAELLRFLAPSFIQFEGQVPSTTCCARYDHIGALFADTALQAGVNYANVVKPRVDALLAHYPKAMTISKITSVLDEISSRELLNWTHHEKPRRFIELLRVSSEGGVETVSDLSEWITLETSRARLRRIKGIGPKSVDYIRMLVGQPVVPMDRHLFKIVAMAGVGTSDYSSAQTAFVEGAIRAGLSVSFAERSVWRLMSACS